jgi:hypothetical protein
MKQLGCHATAERTNRRHEQKLRMTPKIGGFAEDRVCWAGNRRVKERRQVSESKICGEGGVAEGSRDSRVKPGVFPERV